MAKVTVTKGQTLSGIAKAAGTTVAAIAAANPNIKNVNQISVGQNINLPGSTSTKTSSAKSTSTGSTSGGSTKPVATTQASSYNKYGSSTPTPRGSSLSSAPKKTKVGGILSSIGSLFKDAIGTNNKSGYANNEFTFSDGMLQDTPKVNQNQIKSAFEDLTQAYQPIKESFSTKVPIASAETTPQDLTSSTMPLVSTESGSTTEQTTPTINPIQPNKMLSGGNVGTETTKTTETTNPMTGEVTTMSETSPLGSNAMISSAPNADSANKFNTAMSGLNDSIGTMKNNPWDTYSKNGDIVSVANTKINQALGAYTDVASFMNDYQTNPEVKKNVDNYMQVTGKKINDITSKIQTPTNGVVAPQSIDQFLINNKNANLKAEADGLNKAIIMESNFNTQQEKMLYETNDQFKKTQEAIRDSMERNEMRKEASVREKANWMIDKNKAEMEIALADIEQNRLLGKNSLTGLLAKLGALDTTSMSGIALTDLDQKYQAQQQGTRAKYMLANREIQMNMNSDINDLENTMEENIIKINSDLSKSEREVAIDVMKLRYDTQKTALDYKMKYEDALRVEKQKAIDKAESASANYNAQWLQLVGAGIAPEMIPGMLDSKGKIKQTAENAKIMQTSKIKQPETEPEYTGEVLKPLTLKTATSIIEKTGLNDTDLLQLQKELSQGWSLEQIAKNQGMPTSIFNILKGYITTPN
jgi:hypothetical protein